MQKINFLPQVKLWNSAEFQSRGVWTNPDLGSMTYDGSANRFAVALQGESGPKWMYLLTSDSSTTAAATSLRLMVNASTYQDVAAGLDGILSVYTASAYNSSTNPLATLVDVQAAVAGASVLGMKMDSSIVHIDSSYIILKSDASNPYDDRGDNENGNPLATVGTVKTAITAALGGLGDLFNLQGVYENPYTPESGEQITTFTGLLAYLTKQEQIPFDIKKGTVLIFGKDEYVLLDTTRYSDPIGWEKLGSIDTDTAVISIGGKSGAILLSDSFYMNESTLNLNIANDTSLGGVKTGHTEGAVDSNTKYEFALKVGGSSEDNAGKGYVSIPIVTGADSNASYGLVPNSALSGGAHIYTVTLDPSTLSNGGVAYNQIKSVTINHTIGTDDLVISVYKVRATSAQRSGRQLVYVDEVISGRNSILIDFGSAEAFIGCQDQNDGTYFGYDIVIAASTSAVNLSNDPGTTLTPNQAAE